MVTLIRNRGFAPIFMIVVVALLISGLVGLFLYKTQYKSEQVPATPVDETPERRPTEASDEIESEITTVDATWNLYTNYVGGFSIKFPKEMWHSYGSECEWREGEPMDSYRPSPGLVPTEMFEDLPNNTVYISSEYFYQLSGEETVDDVSYYSECNRVENSVDALGDMENYMQQDWKLVFADVEGDIELDSFIEDRYGTGCTLGEQTLSDQPGVYDVSIDANDEECFINYGTVIRYYPAGNKVVSWNTGQAYTFWGSEDIEEELYDTEMIESFRFLE